MLNEELRVFLFGIGYVIVGNRFCLFWGIIEGFGIYGYVEE